MDEGTTKDTFQNKKKVLGRTIKKLTHNVEEKAEIVVQKSTETVEKTKETVLKAVDVNGDGQIDMPMPKMDC